MTDIPVGQSQTCSSETMRFKKQRNTFTVDNALETLERGRSHTGWKKHGPLLPDSIRSIICGPSNCGKTNLMFKLLTDPEGLKYANVYVFSKSLQQPKYIWLAKLFDKMPEIGFKTFDNTNDVIQSHLAKPNSIMIFDDVACDKQEHMKLYFSMGRHSGIDSFYLIQSYTRSPKHLLRDNANLIVLYRQDDINLKHVYDEHVNNDMSFLKFKELCSQCWGKDKYAFVVIDKDAPLLSGRYRHGLDTFVTAI